MKKSRRYPLTVKRRIYLGFIMMSLLLMALGAVGFWGIWRFHSFFGRFNGLNKHANLQIDIDLTTTEIQRQVTRFMHEGYNSAGLAALESMESLRERIARTRQGLSAAEDLEAALTDIEEHLAVYEQTFISAMEEKQVYNQLIKEDLPNMARELEAMLNSLHVVERSSAHHNRDLLLLTKAKASLLSYFESLDARYAKEAADHVEALMDQVSLYRETVSDIRQRRHIREIESLLDHYQKLTNRAIQATRGYLYYINVVMAGEASEIIYQATRLRSDGEKQKVAMQAKMIQLADRVTFFIAWFTFLPVVAGILYAMFTTRQIISPLHRITATFRQLSDGERVDHIPGSNRLDEIGDLAHSANVFRQRNQETEDLLIRADSLTRELQEKQEALETSNQELEQFVYTVSHDLKSPIVTSMGFIGIIRDLAQAGRMDEAIRKLDRVEEANARMGVLINDLLELSRVGRFDKEHEVLDSEALLQHLRNYLRPSLEREKFKLELMGDFPRIRGNESRVLQVFENLISNALKYGRDASQGKNRIEISCQEDPSRGWNVFRIRDFGPGIPEAYREKVFNLFARLDNSTTGTGIGLAVVRKLMRLHGGEAWIEEPEGPGVIFCIAFPIIREKASEA